jgi:hypothetical protein
MKLSNAIKSKLNDPLNLYIKLQEKTINAISTNINTNIYNKFLLNEIRYLDVLLWKDI